MLSAVAELMENLSTTSGVNAVVGVRPSLWQTLSDPTEVPTGAADWSEDLLGGRAFRCPPPSTTRGCGSPRGAALRRSTPARQPLDRLKDAALELRRETSGWLYRHDRDLTGFVDGSENPSALEAPGVVAIPQGQPGAGSTAVLFQLWRHDSERWDAEPVEVQERAMGRTKPESLELENKPVDSHVARTDQDKFGKIFRRNVAYGDVADHGTVFVVVPSVESVAAHAAAGAYTQG